MNQSPGIYGKKIGFTQLFTDDGSVVRVTVLQTGPVMVMGKRTKEKDGYTALILGLGERKERHTTKPLAGQFKKGILAGSNGVAKRTIKELRCSDEFAAKFEPGAVMKISDVFEVGQKVDARGTTKGRGFTGVMRRWNFAGNGMTHGAHEYHRHGGSIGTNMTPGRTLPNIKMGGHYGDETVSILNLKVARIDEEKNLLMIEGGIPGAKNSLVLVRQAVKTRKRKANR
jgi:large subunit ribosomal protein L3